MFIRTQSIHPSRFEFFQNCYSKRNFFVALSKASRCYQKAFDLDPNCDDAGIALGDSLMELGEEVHTTKNILPNIPSHLFYLHICH